MTTVARPGWEISAGGHFSLYFYWDLSQPERRCQLSAVNRLQVKEASTFHVARWLALPASLHTAGRKDSCQTSKKKDNTKKEEEPEEEKKNKKERREKYIVAGDRSNKKSQCILLQRNPPIACASEPQRRRTMSRRKLTPASALGDASGAAPTPASAQPALGGTGSDQGAITIDPDLPLLAASEDVADKLRILRYSGQLFPKHYWAMQWSVASEQFPAFCQLVAWLCSLLGHSFEAPSQFDDPNSASATILAEVRVCGLQADFAASKLRPGFGPAVIAVLDALCNACLEKARFSFRAPVHPTEDADADEDQDVEDDGEDIGDVPDDAFDSEDEGDATEGALVGGAAADGRLQQRGLADGVSLINGQQQIAGGLIDPADWRLELERVAPMLKVKTQNDGAAARDWRSHLEWMQRQRAELDAQLPATTQALAKLSDEISKALEKIDRREKSIKSNFELQSTEYRASQLELARAEELLAQSNMSLSSLTNELARTTEDLSNLKADMERKGQEMTNTGPLIAIKDAIARIKEEIKQTDFQIGVLRSSILQAELNNKLRTKGAGHSSRQAAEI